MNLVGKIFTVLIFVMSLVFATFTVAVYSTHKNYRDLMLNDKEAAGKPLGLKFQLANARDLNKKLENDILVLEGKIASAKKTQQNALAQLVTVKSDLEAEVKRAEEAQSDILKISGKAATDADTAQTEMKNLRTEIEGLRESIIAARNEKDENFKEVVRLTDDLHQRVLQLTQLKKQYQKAQEEIIRLRNIIARVGVNPDADPDSVTPVVESVVTAVLRDNMVEIKVGTDDAIKPGIMFDVTRTSGPGAGFIGRIQVVKCEPDKSACKILKDWLQRPIQVGDIVKTVTNDKQK